MLYFRGCTARQKETGIADATEKLLKLADVDYHILDDEKCCGSVLLRTGFEKEAKKQIAKNTEVFGDETILTHVRDVIKLCFRIMKVWMLFIFQNCWLF